MILCDAQTSGGLLMSVPRNKSGILRSSLEKAGVPTIAEIGRIVDDETRAVRVLR